MIGKIIRNGVCYEFCELDEPETYTTVNRLIEFNLSRFFKILADLQKYNNGTGPKLTKRQLVDIALAVFDKSGIKSYPVLKSALHRKVNNAKEFSKVQQESERESAFEQQAPEPPTGCDTCKQLEGGD
jgi:hypothetical protein